MRHPSPVLQTCDVLESSEPARLTGIPSCPAMPIVSAADAVQYASTAVDAEISTVLPVDQLEPGVRYDMWLVAADYSVPPNLQVRHAACCDVPLTLSHGGLFRDYLLTCHSRLKHVFRARMGSLNLYLALRLRPLSAPRNLNGCAMLDGLKGERACATKPLPL